MLHLLSQGVLLYAVSWIAWKALKRFVINGPIDNIPGPVGTWWLGVLPRLFNPNAWAFHDELILKYGRVSKIKGAFGENQLYVTDPLALHHIIVKDQYIYEESAGFLENNNLQFGPGLLATQGDIHKRQRKLLNPVFSSAHMRDMVPIFFDIAFKLSKALDSRVADGPKEIDLLDWMTRTALELVGQSGLGTSFDSLVEDKALHPFPNAIKGLMPNGLKLLIPRTYLLPIAVKIGTPSFRRFVLGLIPWRALHNVRDIVDVMHQTSLDIYRSKLLALSEGDDAISRQVAKGKDIMSILLRANMDASEEDKLSEEELIGQMTTLTFAATDTTSTALSRTLTLLATHQEVQDRLRDEVRKTLAGKEILSYDELNDMKYLDAICRETLRLFPPIPWALRTTRKDVVLPLGSPIQGIDGKTISEIPIPNNTNVIVSIIGCNRDPSLWGEDSYEWKPERWMQPLPEEVTKAHIPGVYSSLMTFLGGGRSCIGFKFSQLEMKVVLSILISTFKFSPAEKEIQWRMTAITSPSVRGSNEAQLPLIVEAAT